MTAHAQAETFKTFPATKLKSNAGEVLDHARNAPVLITNHGRDCVYLVSSTLFGRLMELDDADLIVRAQAAIDGGVMSAANSVAFLKSLQHEKPGFKQRSPKKS